MVDIENLALVPDFTGNLESKFPEVATTSHRRIVILGSTGSIGRSSLDVIRKFPELFSVYALVSYGSNLSLFVDQIKEFKPKRIAVCDAEARARLLALLASEADLEIGLGIDTISEICQELEVDMVLAAIVGVAGLKPVIASLQAKKPVALANKESLVVAGKLVQDLTRSNGPLILPVDSEHSAIFQALRGLAPDEVSSIVLTASGGPFLRKSLEELRNVSVEQAISHPRWKMGAKISVDSATLMNKGLELIEAYYLFGLKAEKLKAVIHPQSYVHGLVNLVDGSSLLQASEPDMKEPIAFALNYPRMRLAGISKSLDLARLGTLIFEEIDHNRFPAVNLALSCIEQGSQACLVFNEANEQAVAAFLKGKLQFLSIVPFVEEVLGLTPSGEFFDLESLYEYREKVLEICNKLIQKF